MLTNFFSYKILTKFAMKAEMFLTQEKKRMKTRFMTAAVEVVTILALLEMKSVYLR